MTLEDFSWAHKDALNITQHWFGGSIHGLDLFVASIDKSLMRDLTEGGYLRSRWIGWEITYKGRQALSHFNLTSWRDTRRG